MFQVLIAIPSTELKFQIGPLTLTQGSIALCPCLFSSSPHARLTDVIAQPAVSCSPSFACENEILPPSPPYGVINVNSPAELKTLSLLCLGLIASRGAEQHLAPNCDCSTRTALVARGDIAAVKL